MLSNALAISIMVTGSFLFLYQKMPPSVRAFIVKYSIIADVLAMVSTYWMFGGTVTALMAGAMVDLMISALLYIANHPQDFSFLFDIIEMMKGLVEKGRAALADMNAKYKESRSGQADLFV